MFNVPMSQCVKSKVTFLFGPFYTCYMSSLTYATPPIHSTYSIRGCMGGLITVNDNIHIPHKPMKQKQRDK